MNFLKSLGGLVGANAATGGLPYVIDAPPSSSSSVGDAGTECGAFLLFPGHAKSDTTHAVSIFKSRDAASPPSQNALRRIKTLRHPNVLAFLDGVETPNNGPVILVTERVTPLPQFLEELRRQCETPDAFQQSVAWGLRSILLALQFLTVDCKLLHGRVSPHSVFVTKGGDWKLAGLELTGEVSERGPSSHFTAYESMWADPQYKSPEWQRRDWSAMAPPSSADMYAFAELAFYVLNDSQLRVGELSSATNIPHALRMPYRKALDADPHKRPRPDKVLASSFFDSAFIKRMDFVENLAVKTPEDKVEFFKELSTHLPTLPPLFAVHKVLPALKAVVEFGTNKTSSSAVLKLDPSASHMLPAMVQIGSTLLTPEEFKDQVLPVLVKLFSCNDRAVRVQLLQMLEKFAVHLDAKLVNSTVIFDNLCSGFTDAAPVLRELTVKSMLHIADKLSDANLNTRVMKHFAKLQTDPEPAIRTNTTICLGRIASKLSDATRPKVLFPAFSRALRDPFPHARLAGLRSLTACEEFFTPQAMAGSIVPVLAPLLLDVSVSVREQASLSMDLFMKKVMDEAAQMKVREAQQAQEQKLRQENGTADPAPAAGGSSSSGVSVAGSGSSYAASLTSWAASAVATNVSKIVGAGASSPTPPSSSSGASHQPHQQQSTSTHHASTSSSSAFAADDDFGADDDAWGDDDELDGFGSPKAPARSSFGSAPASRTGSLSSSSSSSMKLTTATRPTARGSLSSSTTSTSTFAMAPTDGGWGDDDNWGGDDDLGFGTTTTAASSKPATSSLRVGATSSSSSLQVGNAASRTSSFGSTTAPASSSSSFFSTQTTTTTASSSLSSGASSSVRKPVSERMAEAKAKRESLGAMKLDTTKKKGDEWDNWDF